MNRHESEQCNILIDCAIDGQPTPVGMENCHECENSIRLINELQKIDSVYSDETYPALKARILHKIAPTLATIRQPSLSERVTQFFSAQNYYKLSFAAVTGIILLLALVNLHLSNRVVPGSENLITLPSSQVAQSERTFLVSYNSGPSQEISLDSPVSLSNDEQCLITVPDGTTLEVMGPARLSVGTSGFHLFKGYAKTHVTPGNSGFVATTPHARVHVLGTVFTLNTTQRETTVEVSTGRVSVHSSGQSIEMGPGESAEFNTIPGPDEIQGQTIPDVDNE